MSKKTKRLEKENHNLTRKHDLTNHNILQMAEERTRTGKEMEMLRKKNENLEKLCRGMQAQGRGQVLEDEGTESEYEYEDDEDEDGSDGEYDDTEEEGSADHTPGPPAFGPTPPPPPTSAGAQAPANSIRPNGQVNGQVNGIKNVA